MNPYSVDENSSASNPASVVAGASLDGKQFHPEGLAVGAGRVTSWLGYGFEQFKASIGVWIGITLIFLVLVIVLSFIPFFGSLALNILYPVFGGGLMLACHAYAQNQEVKIEHLFAGFKEKFGPLAIVGLLSLAAAIAVVIVLGIVIAIFAGSILATGAMAGAGGGNQALLSGLAGVGIGMVLLLILVSLLVFIPLTMAFWLAPALVVLNNMTATEAIGASFKASMKNIGAFLLFGVLYFVLAIVASIPVFLGWLVLIPVLIGAVYAAYRDYFYA